MEFKLNYQVESAGFDYSVNISECKGRVNLMVQALTDKLTDDQYHELCHQLYGTKMEFDDIDGECKVGNSLEEKKYYTVSSSLYRGIFWATLNALDNLDEDEEERREEREEDQD